jgi:hypothetical protein
MRETSEQEDLAYWDAIRHLRKAEEQRDQALEALRYIRDLVSKRQLPITDAVWESADSTLERIAKS